MSLFFKVNVLVHMTEIMLSDWQSRRLDKYRKLFKKMVNQERRKIGGNSQSQEFPNVGAHAFRIILQSENEGGGDTSDPSESSFDSDEEKVRFIFSALPNI